MHVCTEFPSDNAIHIPLQPPQKPLKRKTRESKLFHLMLSPRGKAAAEAFYR